MTGRTDNNAVIARLQGVLRDELKNLIPQHGDHVLLDFPNHSNIGDSAIYLGEAILLREHFGRRPSLVTEARQPDFDALARHQWKGPLLLHGGGNFGDIWPRHQLFREEIIRRYRDRQIIQLPQSLHFSDEANLARAAEAINAHPDFTLMVRDEESRRIATSAFTCNVRLVPDMAFMIGPVAPPVPADKKILCLLRQDKETVLSDTQALAGLPASHIVVDWPAEQRRIRFGRLPRRLRQFLPAPMQGYAPQSPAAFEWLARQRVERGFALLSRGEAILTDRLHAHILSLLLGKPHVTLDNFYGKIRNFARAWTRDGDFRQAETLETAVEQANALLARDRR